MTGALAVRARLAAHRPYWLDDIMHHEEWWYKGERGRGRDGHRIQSESGLAPMRHMYDEIGSQLEPRPVMIPPVLVKADLGLEPLFTLLWQRAAEAVRAAERVVFVGYSMPTTDIAVQYMFAEAIEEACDLTEIAIVDRKGASETARAATKRVCEAYAHVLRSRKAKINVDGAIEWARQFATQQPKNYSRLMDSWRPPE